MPVAEERKAFFAKRELLNQLSEIAAKKGVSLYSLVNEVFAQYLRLEGQNTPLDKLLEEHKFHQVASKLGMVYLPVLVAVTAISKTCGDSEVLKVWRESGEALAKYYQSVEGRSLGELFQLVSSTIGWLGSIEGSFNDSGGARIIVSAPGLPGNCIDSLEAFVRGVLEPFGYQILNSEKRSGLIIMWAKR